VIRQRLGRPVVDESIVSIPAEAVIAREPMQPLDVQSALQRFGGNRAVYGRALRTFAFDASALVARLAAVTGPTQGDELRHSLHALKGLASTIGATHLALLAAEAEKISYDKFLALWPALQRTAQQSIEHAEQQAKRYMDQQRAQDEVGDVAPATPVVEGLEALSRLLRDSNMEALALFDQLQHQYGTKYPLAFVQLSQAVSQLNFPQALRYCEELKRLVEGNMI